MLVVHQVVKGFTGVEQRAVRQRTDILAECIRRDPFRAGLSAFR